MVVLEASFSAAFDYTGTVSLRMYGSIPRRMITLWRLTKTYIDINILLRL